MENNYYKTYQEWCFDLERLAKKYHGDVKEAKKLRGLIAVELLKRVLDEYIKSNGLPYKTSMENSYIAGSNYEYDLLVLSEKAEPHFGFVYMPEDVIAILESKTRGLYNVETNTDNIAKAVNCAMAINPDIRFGYITITENVPKNDHNKSTGKPTVKHWELTKKYLDEKIKGDVAEFAVTLHTGKKLCDEGSDEELDLFIKFLLFGSDT